MSISRAKLVAEVQSAFDQATKAANKMVKLSEARIRARAASLAGDPKYGVLDEYDGVTGWAAVLSVDLRNSSQRAVKVGARDTYLTMHTYLTAMVCLVEGCGGLVAGLRGDGLFALFGISKDHQPSGQAVQNAAVCGFGMAEAVRIAVNPVLRAGGVEAGLRVRAAVGAGDVVVTKVGWRDAIEVTAYGPAINGACKARGRGDVLLTEDAFALYPSSENGQAEIDTEPNGYSIAFPPGASPIKATGVLNS